MLKDSQSQLLSFNTVGLPTPEEALHAKCGVYTMAHHVDAILDAVGWKETANLQQACLLEPSCGDGAFVVRAAERLLRALSRTTGRISPDQLAGRILAFELLEAEAAKARDALVVVLRNGGLSQRTASSTARKWVRTEDFLLARCSQRFTHIVGNPPYCRWSRVPASLRAKYEAALPRSVAKGDIFLPFLSKGIELLASDGTLGFVCSDRWKFAAFAEQFRTQHLGKIDILRDQPLDASEAFQRRVDAYSTMLVLRRSGAGAKVTSANSKRTISDAGFRIRVGPALGCTSAYVLLPHEKKIEKAIRHTFLESGDIVEGAAPASAKQVMIMHRPNGELIDLERYPKAKERLLGFRKRLKERAVVRVSGAAWYAPIDRVRLSDWSEPKLLVPELAKVPRFSRDDAGAIPSHGVYAVFGPSLSALEELADLWRDGGLARALEGRAPKVKGGYVRCYKTFLAVLPSP